MTSREEHALLDILLAAEDALSYVKGLDEDGFAADRMKRDAVLHCLTVIGEAARRIMRGTEENLPDLPWRAMNDLRNLIVHQYEGVNLAKIWAVTTEHLPTIVAVLGPQFPEREPRP